MKLDIKIVFKLSRRKLAIKLKLFMVSLLILPGLSYAGKKILIFEDGETLGKGGLQTENYLLRSEPRTTEYTFNLTYGLTDRVDVGLNVPFTYEKKLEGSNLSLDLKGKVFEKEKSKVALKFSSEIPTKDENFKYGPTLALQTSVENLSFYATSSYELRHREFFQSVSAEWKPTERLGLILTGFYSSEGSQTGAIGGLTLSGKSWEFALGVKKVFESGQKPSAVAGLTIRFK